MKTYAVVVTQTVHVTLDETKFDHAFMDEFNRTILHFDSLEDHAKHIAQMAARGVIDVFDSFIEGYGPPKDMGITFKVETDDVTVMGSDPSRRNT